jgi:NADP-dependent 3-hydroxy acid dehydrogenase YdfG
MTSAAAATEWYILKQVVPLSRAQNKACKMLARVAAQVDLLVVCAGYQKLDSLQDLDFDDLDKHWQVKHLPIPYLLRSQTIHPLLKQQCLD